MDWIVSNLWLIPLLPLIAAGLSALAPRPQKRFAAGLAIGSMALALVLSLVAFGSELGRIGTPLARQVVNVPWFELADGWVRVGWVLDPLTAVMLVMVCLVGLMIFVYSVGYMAHDENFTRFFLVRRAGDTIPDPVSNKISLAFSVENKPGSLVAALNRLSALGTNLTKIESRPVHGKPWEYIFYVDCQLHTAGEADQAVAALKSHCAMLKELGRYQEAMR